MRQKERVLDEVCATIACLQAEGSAPSDIEEDGILYSGDDYQVCFRRHGTKSVIPIPKELAMDYIAMLDADDNPRMDREYRERMSNKWQEWIRAQVTDI